MRLFVGLRPSEEFRAALSMLQSQLQSAGVAARYLDPSRRYDRRGRFPLQIRPWRERNGLFCNRQQF